MAAQLSNRFTFSSICLFLRHSFVHVMATLALMCVLLCCSTMSNDVIVFQGSMVEFSIDKYQSKMVERKGERKTSVGVENNRYWRKDVYSDGVRVYYDHVPKRNKAVYDKVLDEIAFRQLRRDE